VIGYLSTKTGSYTGGLLYLVVSGLVGSALVLSLRPHRSESGPRVEAPKPELAVSRS
jgi:hypothetical protein